MRELARHIKRSKIYQERQGSICKIVGSSSSSGRPWMADRETTGCRRRRRLGRRGARMRPGIGKGGRGDPVDVLTRGGRQRNRPDTAAAELTAGTGSSRAAARARAREQGGAGRRRRRSRAAARARAQEARPCLCRSGGGARARLPRERRRPWPAAAGP
jgi:hypothetical protein